MELTDKFDWGNSDQEFIDGIEQEVFINEDYDWLYPVKEGDVVLDLGASVGPFTWKIMDKASKVYAFEPMPNTYPTLEKNVKGYPVEVVKKALYHTTGTFRFPFIDEGMGQMCGSMPKEEERRLRKEGLMVDTTTFQDFLKEYNVDKIDFIKTDTEGGEYNLFRAENIDFLRNNVRNIVGEWHLKSEAQMVEFRYFRDKFLKHFPNYKIFSATWDGTRGSDITWSVFKDKTYDSVNAKNLPPFIDFYQLILVYIDNES